MLGLAKEGGMICEKNALQYLLPMIAGITVFVQPAVAEQILPIKKYQKIHQVIHLQKMLIQNL